MIAIDTLPTRTRIKTRAIHGLQYIGKQTIAYEIKNCSERKYCSNPYCLTCQRRMVQSLKTRVWAHVSSKYAHRHAEALQSLRYVTLLFSLAPLDAKRVRNEVTNIRQMELYRVRRAFPNLWVQGAFDFECVDTHKVICEHRACPANAALIATLSDGELFSDPNRVLVHAHMIVDLDDIDPERFRRVLENIWHAHPLQISVKRLYGSQQPDADIQTLLKTNIYRMAKYAFKRETNFKYSVDSNVRVKGSRLNPELIGHMASIYSSLGGNGYQNLLISWNSRDN